MRTRVLLAVLVLCLSVAVPTAAVATQRDDAGPVTLAPTEEGNGAYASVEGGELRVAFDRLTERSLTTAHDVFTVTGSADEPVRVWVTVDTEEGVTAYRGDDPSESLGSESEALTLEQGESLSVGFRIDTRTADPDSGTVTVHAVPVSEGGGGTTASPTPDGTDGGTEQPPDSGGDGGTDTPAGDTPTATPGANGTATPTPGQTAPSIRVVDVERSPARLLPGERVTVVATVANDGDEAGSVTLPLAVAGERVDAATVTVPADERRQVRFQHRFDEPGRYTLQVGEVPAGAVTVERPGAVAVVGPDGDSVEVDVTDRERLPDDGEPSSPGASIEVASGLSATAADGVPVVRRGEPFRLAATGTTVGTADAIAPGGRAVRIVDLGVPDGAAEGGTVRVHVDREAFDAAAGEGSPQVARFVDGDWRLLPTRVVDRTDDTVVVAATLDGDGVLAVFPDGRVRYDWGLRGGTATGVTARLTVDTAGSYEPTLTVTDARGATDTTTGRLLVNDAPTVAVERVDTAGDGVTLRSNVTNEVGNATVTWTLPDGTTVRGPTVTGDFAPGDTLQVTVEDEFGASDSLRWTLGSAPAAGGGGDGSTDPVAAPFGLSPPGPWLLGLVGVVIAFVLVRLQLVGEPLFSFPVAGLEAALRGRAPRVTVSGETTWDASTGVVVLSGLDIDGGPTPLERVELTVRDADGGVVVRKTVDVDGRHRYRAGTERIRLPAGVDLTGSYRVTVRAVDSRDRSGSAEWVPGGPTGA